MIRILIKTPFRHQFRNKDSWLMAHDYYYLDSTRDKDELKYILSPIFAFKEFIYINLNEIDSKLLKEVQEEYGFSPVGNSKPEEFVEKPQHSVMPVEEAAFLPPKEPEPNIFAVATAVNNSPILITNPVSTKQEVEEVEEVKTVGGLEVSLLNRDFEKEERKTALDNLHWRKLKDVAEQYSIEYTDKEEVIDKIISIEFE